MLSEEQIERYARHILLREVGGVGQERLLGAAVRIEGLGQVGSWACLYLALAGVGRLELCDPRPVPEAGLSPVLVDLGAPSRAEAVAHALGAHNPDVRCEVVAPARPGGSADESLLAPSGESGLLWARAAGATVGIGWVERPPCARCFPEEPPAPAAAALAGSLAASRLLGRLLFGEAAPEMLRIHEGVEEVAPPCPHA